MGRPKGYQREEVLDQALQVFWRRGFAETSLADLEKATGVNKSGLYSEFKDKEDLFLSSLHHYIETSGVQTLLTTEPLGRGNVEAFLKAKSCSKNKGCFAVNSLRESGVLPAKAAKMIAAHLDRVRDLLAQNIMASKSRLDPKVAAEMILTFNAGLRTEDNLARSEGSDRHIDAFLDVIFR